MRSRPHTLIPVAPSPRKYSQRARAPRGGRRLRAHPPAAVPAEVVLRADLTPVRHGQEPEAAGGDRDAASTALAYADNIDYVSIEWYQQRCERSVHLFPHLLLSALAPLLPEKHSGPRRRNVTGAFGADVATSLEGLESLGRGAEMRHHRPPDTARPPWGKDPHHLPRVHHGAFVIRRLSMVALWHRKTLCVL